MNGGSGIPQKETKRRRDEGKRKRDMPRKKEKWNQQVKLWKQDQLMIKPKINFKTKIEKKTHRTKQYNVTNINQNNGWTKRKKRIEILHLFTFIWERWLLVVATKISLYRNNNRQCISIRTVKRKENHREMEIEKDECECMNWQMHLYSDHRAMKNGHEKPVHGMEDEENEQRLRPRKVWRHKRGEAPFQMKKSTAEKAGLILRETQMGTKEVREKNIWRERRKYLDEHSCTDVQPHVCGL